MAPPKSIIWNYYQTFNEGESKVGRCKSCDKTVKCGVSGTNGLKVHLKIYHDALYQEFLMLRKEKRYLSQNSDTDQPNFSNEVENANNENHEGKKMKSESVILSGDEFLNDAAGALKSMLDDKHFANVTIVTEDAQKISAHKIILSSFSPIFRDILLENTHQHPLLYFRGIKHEYMQAIMKFMYLGQTRIGLLEVKEFMKIASELQIKGLSVDTSDTANNDALVDEEEKNNIEFSQFNFDKINAEETMVSDHNYDSSTEILSESMKDEMIDDHSTTAPQKIDLIEAESDDANNGMDRINIACDFPGCKYVAAQKRYLREHRQAIHEGIKYPCDFCEHKGSTKSNLKKHLMIKHSENKEMYPCHQCDFQGTDLMSLSSHTSAEHMV